jgi:hypothetical protein
MLALSTTGYCSFALALPIGYSGAPQTRASSGAASAKNATESPERILFATKNPDGTITKHFTDEEITALMPKIQSLDDAFAYTKRRVGDKDAFESVVRRMSNLQKMLLRFSRRHGLSSAEIHLESFNTEFLKGQILSVKV